MHMPMRIHIHTHTHTCIHAYINTKVHTHKSHTYIHTHTRTYIRCVYIQIFYTVLHILFKANFCYFPEATTISIILVFRCFCCHEQEVECAIITSIAATTITTISTHVAVVLVVVVLVVAGGHMIMYMVALLITMAIVSC